MPSRAPSAAAVPPNAFEPAWIRDVGRSLAGPIALGDSVIATQSTDRWLTVVTRAGGQLVWRSRLHSAGATGPLFVGNRLFAASAGEGGRVYGYDLLRERRRWSRRIGPVVGPLATGAGAVYAATRDGLLVAMDAERGTVRWQRRLSGAVRVGPVVAGTALLVGVDDSLFLVSRDDGSTRQGRFIPDAVVAPGAVVGTRIAVTSPAGWVALLDGRTLETIWERRLDAATFGSPAIARDTVFVTTLDGAVWSIPIGDPESAVRRDVWTPMRAGPAPTGRGMLLGTLRGEVLYFDGPGAAVWQDQIDGPIEEAPILSRGELFAVDGRGRIHVWRAP